MCDCCKDKSKNLDFKKEENYKNRNDVICKHKT